MSNKAFEQQSQYLYENTNLINSAFLFEMNKKQQNGFQLEEELLNENYLFRKKNLLNAKNNTLSKPKGASLCGAISDAKYFSKDFEQTLLEKNKILLQKKLQQNKGALPICLKIFKNNQQLLKNYLNNQSFTIFDQVNCQLLIEQLEATIKIYFFNENLILTTRIFKYRGRKQKKTIRIFKSQEGFYYALFTQQQYEAILYSQSTLMKSIDSLFQSVLPKLQDDQQFDALNKEIQNFFQLCSEKDLGIISKQDLEDIPILQMQAMNFKGNDDESQDKQKDDDLQNQCMQFSLPKKKAPPKKTSIDMIREEIVFGKDDENECSIQLDNECSLENIGNFEKSKNDPHSNFNKNEIPIESDILENQQEEENIKKNQNEDGEWGIQSLDDISNSIQEGKKQEEYDGDENIQTKSMERVDPEEEKEEDANLIRQTSLPVGQNLLKAFQGAKKVQKLVKQATLQSKQSGKMLSTVQGNDDSAKNSKKKASNQSILSNDESDIKMNSLKHIDDALSNQETSQQQQFQQKPEQKKNLASDVPRQVSLPVNVLNVFADTKYNNEMKGLIDKPQYNNEILGLIDKPQYNNEILGLIDKPQYNNEILGLIDKPQQNNEINKLKDKPQYNNEILGLIDKPQYNNEIKGQIDKPQYNNEILGLIDKPQYNNEMLGLIDQPQSHNKYSNDMTLQQDQPNFSVLANMPNMPKFNIEMLFNQEQQQQQQNLTQQQQQQQQQKFPNQQFASPPPNLSKSPDNFFQQVYFQNQNQQQQQQFNYDPCLPRSQSGLQPYQYDYYYAQKQQQQQQQQYQQQSYQNYMFFKNNSNTKQEKRKPLVLNESRDKYYGTVKFFDEHKLYGFIILDFDNSEIFFHMDDVVSPKVTKEYIATYKSGNIIRFKFSLMTYIGKYNQSRKATELELVQLNEMYQQQ